MRQVGRIWLSLLLMTAGASAADNPPAPLSRYFPAKDLVVYVEFDGIDAHAEAWKKTAAHKILNETPTGAMLESVIRQCFLVQGKVGDFEIPRFEDASAITRQLVRSGFAIGINRKADDPADRPSSVGLVLRGGARGPLLPMFRKFLAMLGVDDAEISKDGGAGGRKLSRFGSLEMGFSWWTEGDDLVLALIHVQSAGAMIAAIEGRVPNASDHPWRKELASVTDGIENVGLAFLDLRTLPELPEEYKMLGLDGIKRVDLRWGFRGEALETVTQVIAPAPRKGLLSLFDQPTFDAKSLPPLPSGVGSFAATSVDLVNLFDQSSALAKQFVPDLGGPIDQFAELFQAGTGRRLREDVLSRIGPKVLFAEVPTRVLVPFNPFDAVARSLARVPRMSLLVEIKDRVRLMEDLETLANWANDQFPIKNAPKAGEKPALKLVRRLKNVELGYEIAIAPTYWPLPAGYRPSIVVGEHYLSLGTTPDVARLALKPEVGPDQPMARALASLPAGMTLVSLTDIQNSALPEILANIPAMVQWVGLSFKSALGATSIPGGLIKPQVKPAAPAPPAAPKPVDAIDDPGSLELAVKIREFRIRLDPDEVPSPEEIRPLLFPASFALSSNAQGFRIETRKAFPDWNPFPLVVSIELFEPLLMGVNQLFNAVGPTTNLAKIGKALNAYEQKEGHFPGPAILSQDGKPLLSWRVAILPYLGQQSLYNEFHLNEPWDSPHNKTLLERMPAEFSHPSAKTEPGLTFYRGVIGKGAFFDPELKEGVPIAQFTDGTANTLAMVEAREAVPWTKPGTEISFDNEPMMPKLGGKQPGKFTVLFAFGGVKVIEEALDPVILRAISTRAEGEVVNLNEF